MDGAYGCYNVGGLDGLRTKNPKIKSANGDDLEIPFSSDIKFNLIIRDMNTEQKTPTHINDNICIYLKGAPERVVNRCTTMLVEGD